MILPAEEQRRIMDAERRLWRALDVPGLTPIERLRLAGRRVETLDCQSAEWTAILAEVIEACNAR